PLTRKNMATPNGPHSSRNWFSCRTLPGTWLAQKRPGNSSSLCRRNKFPDQGTDGGYGRFRWRTSLLPHCTIVRRNRETGCRSLGMRSPPRAPDPVVSQRLDRRHSRQRGCAGHQPYALIPFQGGLATPAPRSIDMEVQTPRTSLPIVRPMGSGPPADTSSRDLAFLIPLWSNR